MPQVQIILDADGCWPDLKGIDLSIHGELVGIAYMSKGTLEGFPTVTLRIHRENGEVILAETTLKLFLMSARAFLAKAESEGFNL